MLITIEATRTTLSIIQFISLITFIILVITNILSGEGAIGNGGNSKISNKYLTNFTPAGYAFSIWGIIFFLQGVYCVYILLPLRLVEKWTYMQALNLLLPVGWILESLWSFLFSYELIPSSAVIMYIIWGIMAVTYYQINQIPMNVLHILFHGPSSTFVPEDSLVLNRGRFWFIFDYAVTYLPTAMNFGWITVASIANTFIWATFKGTPFGSTVAALMVVVATLAGFFMLFKFRDIIYPMVILWALIALAKQEFHLVTTVCWICIASLSVGTSFMFIGIVYFSITGKRGLLREHNEYSRQKLLSM